MLVNYNLTSANNPLSIFPAYRLHENRIYERLVARFGVDNIYMLSAGWGLVRADFLTPYYDITFSQSAEGYKRRKMSDGYRDFRMLPELTDEEIFFFGGKDYLPLFLSLTKEVPGKKTVFYNSDRIPQAPDCIVKRFKTTSRTNWHYSCAHTVLSMTHISSDTCGRSKQFVVCVLRARNCFIPVLII